MVTDKELMSLEKRFWTDGADYFRQNLDEKCLVAFTEMAKVMSKEEVAATIKPEDRFKDVDLQTKGLLQVDDNTAVLTYQASAKRPDGKPYKALVSSGYARRNGKWKMMFHQQTPLAA